MTPAERVRHEVRQSGSVRLWWRDDDLRENSANFDELMRVADSFAAPVLLAVIPGSAAPSLDIGRTDPQRVFVCQHGWTHANHQPPGDWDNEYGGHRDPAAVHQELAEGRAILDRLFGARALPVFVPPWNRFDERHLPALVAHGFTGYSTFDRRPGSFIVPGLRQANTHVDLMRWDAPGGPAPLPVNDALDQLADRIRDQRENPSRDPEALGILTHHEQMHGEAWVWLKQLLATLAAIPGIAWMSPPQVFAPPS